jgi:hypothetical protein
MTALTVDTAKNIGIAVAIGLVALMVVMALVIKNITAKLITVLIIGALAFVVWTQRSSLEDCADKVRARGLRGDTSDVECRFLGLDVNVSVPGAP